jgi:hypothetical protein
VKNAKRKVTITPIVKRFFKEIRIMQLEPDLPLIGLNDDYITVVDKYAIDFDKETEPIGPCTETLFSPIFWYNDPCIWAVAEAKLPEAEYIEALRGVDFIKPKDGANEEV